MVHKIYITEEQFSSILLNEFKINGEERKFRPIKDIAWRLALLAMKGVVPLMVINQSIDCYKGMTSNEKEETKALVKKYCKEHNNISRTSNEAPSFTQSSTEDTKRPKKDTLISTDAVVTVYNACKEQCNDDYGTTASGFKLNVNNPQSHKVCAMERTFMKRCGIKYGDIIYVKGTYKGEFDGYYQVQDTMNKRFAGQNKIDILVNKDIKYGGTWPDTTAMVYKVNDQDKIKTILNTMAKEGDGKIK